jgi:Ni2+-binding GTPase involved in maturation of urease and hydrogenase
MKALYKRVRTLNPSITIIETSCKTGKGIKAWAEWLANEVSKFNAI